MVANIGTYQSYTNLNVNPPPTYFSLNFSVFFLSINFAVTKCTLNKKNNL